MSADEAIATLAQMARDESSTRRQLLILDVTDSLAGALGMDAEACLARAAAANLRIAGETVEELVLKTGGQP